MSWATWNDLGGPPPTGRAVHGVAAYAFRDYIMLFAVGTDQLLYWRIGYATTWGDWKVAMVDATKQPVAATTAPVAGTENGYLYVFAGNQQGLIIGYSPPLFGSVNSLRCPMTALVANGYQLELFWFVRGGPVTQFSPESSPPGLCAGIDPSEDQMLVYGISSEAQPSGVIRDGQHHIFYIDGSSVEQVVNDGSWHKGTSLGGQAVYGTASLVTADDTIRCYTVGTDSQLYVKEGDGQSFSDWEVLPGGLAASAPTVVPPLAIPNACFTSVFVLGPEGHVWTVLIIP